MTSNDSNEQGNDTAAAFQVGDRVRMTLGGRECEGIIDGADPEDSEGVSVLDAEGIYSYYIKRADLTLITRATPASAPASESAKTCARCGHNVTEAWHLIRCETCGDLVCGDCLRFDHRMMVCIACKQRNEPATPALAATAPALELGRLEYNIRLASQAIQDAGALSTDQTESIVCVALNQVDVALHALYDAVRTLAAQQQSGK